MNAILRLLFVVAVILAGAIVYSTSADLPTRVASHFGPGGIANGWMSHESYVIFMLAMSTVFPLGIAGAIGLVPAAGRTLLRRSSRMQTRDDVEHALGFLGGAAALVGLLICGFMVVMHVLVVEANQRAPARLDQPAFATALITFLALLFLVIAALGLRFGSLRGPLRS